MGPNQVFSFGEGMLTRSVYADIRVSAFLNQYNRTPALQTGPNLPYADLKGSPLILIGSFDNYWTRVISADHAPSYDDIYEVGFLGHGTLNTIAYVMATAIAEDRGPQGLADLLTQPSYMFFLRYEQLPKYGQDDHHPALGPHTVAAAKLQADACK